MLLRVCAARPSISTSRAANACSILATSPPAWLWNRGDGGCERRIIAATLQHRIRVDGPVRCIGGRSGGSGRRRNRGFAGLLNGPNTFWLLGNAYHVAAGAFGRVHGLVRRLEQVGRLGHIARAARGEPDTDRHPDCASGQR